MGPDLEADEVVGVTTIPEGRFAVAVHRGPNERLAECTALLSACEAVRSEIAANADDEEYDRGCYLVGHVALLLEIALGARMPDGASLTAALLRLVPAPGEGQLTPPSADPAAHRRFIDALHARRDAALRLQLLDWLADPA